MVLSIFDKPITPVENVQGELLIRSATVEDGSDIWKVVGDTGVLDLNSSYAYVLLCHHFHDTCLVAEIRGQIVGFVTAYIPPSLEDTIFIWQIGVAEQMRQKGIARKLLEQLIQMPACREVSMLETTISPSNQASQALFQGFAQSMGVPCKINDGFGASLFKYETHEPEHFYRIGPFRRDT